ncbi:uncharacterized protein LOC118479168 [Aplysia californica]|uniref:Uncharacterized protein LOC118479168 n=1 Tax=Aplysia californica TaxID=6500 RepID=A0ABM1W4W8_APLCA|nr:uncharacterized protein LOC118479168 [Aplysia californica]
MRMLACALLTCLTLTAGVSARVVFRPEGFVKLPDANGAYVLNAGTANKAAFDPVNKLLYVVGHNADVMNIVDMRQSLTNPNHGRVIKFDGVNQGLPNDVKASDLGFVF